MQTQQGQPYIHGHHIGPTDPVDEAIPNNPTDPGGPYSPTFGGHQQGTHDVDDYVASTSEESRQARGS